ncbi:hypothetical protein ACOMHN_037758 [Nucella lapillus]
MLMVDSPGFICRMMMMVMMFPKMPKQTMIGYRPNHPRVYAPKLSATTEVKDEFYENLAASIKNIPSTEHVKRAALADYKKTPSERNLQILRAARNKVKQKAQRCATEYWTQLSDGIPPNLLKHCKSTLQFPQHEVLS